MTWKSAPQDDMEKCSSGYCYVIASEAWQFLEYEKYSIHNTVIAACSDAFCPEHGLVEVLRIGSEAVGVL